LITVLPSTLACTRGQEAVDGGQALCDVRAQAVRELVLTRRRNSNSISMVNGASSEPDAPSPRVRTARRAALHETTSSTVRCSCAVWCSAGVKVPGAVMSSMAKSVNSDSATWLRTHATFTSARAPRRCSTARTPPCRPYPTNPAALSFHSVKR
jgi:hypothetical protein